MPQKQQQKKPPKTLTPKPPSIDELRAQVSRMLDSLDAETPIAATVRFEVAKAKESTFVSNADVLAEATRKLPGVNVFSYHKHTSYRPEPDQANAVGYLIYEDWQSRDLFRAQWDSEHLKSFQGTVGDLLVAPPDLEFFFGSEDIEEARVAQTGLTQCWATNGTLIDCPGTGQDGAVQAGVPSPDPRFTDHGNGTVTDELTGLIWLRDADHYGEVTWAQALANANNLASGSGGLTDDSAAGDWRLPNIRELRSLIDYSSVNPILPIGHPFANVKSAIYWTSTTLASPPGTPAPLAWMTTLGIGPSVFDVKHSANRMWPVRGGVSVAKTGQTQCWDANGTPITCEGTGQDGDIQAGVPSPIPRFIDNQDGTVMDKLTGLVWLKNANPFGFRTWDQALTECNNLANGSHGLTDGSAAGDWRLPNVKEIESLIDYGQVGPSLPAGHPFTGVGPTSYWTSTTVSSAPTQAMFVILGVGPSIFENKEHPFLVWPVRD